MVNQLTHWVLLVACLCTTTVSAQKFTISGFVDDNANGEKLIGTNIYDEASFKGTSTNVYGFYSLTLPKGDYTIVYSFVGYEDKKVPVSLTSDTSINIEMGMGMSLDEFEVTASAGERVEERTQMSTISVPIKQIEKLPALLGETDVLKALQLLPGIQSGNEGSSGIYVRGGGPDQNLILLDGVPVYNASHLFGFFSVFNADALNSVELIKGGFPAHYGGRLSSVIDIRMKEGNMKEFHGKGAVGLISSKLTLEGPIVKNKASFIVSARRTYIDILARPAIKYGFKREGVDGVAGYYFTDLNGKVNWKISDKDRIFLSSYWGDDNFYLRTEDSYDVTSTQTITDKQDAGLRWGNITTALRYNRVISKKLFANLTATYSRYNFTIGSGFETISDPKDDDLDELFRFDYKSGIYDWTGRVDFDFIPTPNHYIKFGMGDIYHTFTPGVTVFEAGSKDDNGIDTTYGSNSIFAHEYFAYVEDDFKIGTRLKMNLGIHYSGFLKGKTHYYSFQPRAAVRFMVTENMSVKASYAEMQQYIHLLTNAGIGLPTDLWVPSTENVLPEESQQIAGGLAQTFRDQFEISVEGYYKWMQNLLEYKEGSSFFSTNADWEDQLEFGKGWSYGGEVFLQKKTGKTTGWIGYTLSWTMREFENLNFGKPYPYRYDRRHDFSIVVAHEFSEKFDIAATWVYGTGNAVSLPTERYMRAGTSPYPQELEHFQERNGYRMRAYHRLDFGVNFHKQKKYWKRTWSFGTYNMYNRANPFFLQYETEYVYNAETQQYVEQRQLTQYSLFPIIPYVSYRFEF